MDDKSFTNYSFQSEGDYEENFFPNRSNYSDQIKAMRRLQLLQDPTKFHMETRKLLYNEYGVPLPSKQTRRKKGGNTLNLKKRVKIGTLSKKHRIIPKENRINPELELPPISENEMRNVCA